MNLENYFQKSHTFMPSFVCSCIYYQFHGPTNKWLSPQKIVEKPPHKCMYFTMIWNRKSSHWRSWNQTMDIVSIWRNDRACSILVQLHCTNIVLNKAVIFESKYRMCIHRATCSVWPPHHWLSDYFHSECLWWAPVCSSNQQLLWLASDWS